MGRWLDTRFPTEDDPFRHYEKPSAQWIIGGEYEVKTNADGSKMWGQPRLVQFRSDVLDDAEVSTARLHDEAFKVEKDAEAYQRKTKGDLGAMRLRDVKEAISSHPMQRAAMISAVLRYLRA